MRQGRVNRPAGLTIAACFAVGALGHESSDFCGKGGVCLRQLTSILVVLQWRSPRLIPILREG
jgi:hypothetical protein